MRLFEAVIDANHRAAAGDAHAGLHPAEFASELPVVALTCIDVRLNSLLPHISTPSPVMPGASVASNVAVNCDGYSSSTLIVSGAVRPSL